jgi:protein phosphatase
MKIANFDAQEIQRRVDAYVQQVQLAMRKYSQADPKSAGMGTTWTCAYLVPPHAVIAHIGDSRAYLHRGKGLHRITRDETMAQQLIDAGLSPDSVKNLGHILTNSFCANFESVSAQIHLLELNSGDRLLLCSDGLTDMVSEQRIERELRQHSKVQMVCDTLVAQALENGGKDNVTVVVADIDTPGDSGVQSETVQIKSVP